MVEIMDFFKKIDKQLYLFLLLVILLILPSFFISPKAVVRSIYPFLIIAAFFNNRKIFAIISTPALYFVPGAIYFWIHYHSPINITFWLILFGSNLNEAIDYISNLKFEILFICFAITFYYIVTLKK